MFAAVETGWRHSSGQKFTCKSQISRVQVKPDQIDVKENFGISYETISEMLFRSVLLSFTFCHSVSAKTYKNTFSARSPRSMCLKVIRPCFLVPMNPHQVVFFEVNQIWGQLWHLLILKKNGSYRHFIPQIWTEIAGYSHMLSAFYPALPSKQPYVGSWWCCFDGRWHCEWLCHGTSWLFGLNSVFPLGSFYDGKLRHCWWEKSG